MVGGGQQPCVVPSMGSHVVTYRNVGGVTVSVTLSADACLGLTFRQTGTPHWSEHVKAEVKTDMDRAKCAEVVRTIDTSGHGGGQCDIDFGFSLDNRGVLALPPTLRLDFTV
jgi:hypothetical protein